MHFQNRGIFFSLCLGKHSYENVPDFDEESTSDRKGSVDGETVDKQTFNSMFKQRDF